MHLTWRSFLGSVAHRVGLGGLIDRPIWVDGGGDGSGDCNGHLGYAMVKAVCACASGADSATVSHSQTRVLRMSHKSTSLSTQSAHSVDMFRHTRTCMIRVV